MAWRCQYQTKHAKRNIPTVKMIPTSTVVSKYRQNLRPLQMVFFWAGFALACSTASLWPVKPFWHTTQRRVKFATSVKLPEGKPNPLKTPQFTSHFEKGRLLHFPSSGKAFSVSPIPNLASPKCWKDLRQDTCCLSFLSTSCKNRKISRSPFEFNIPRSPRLC